ncbi:acetolactate synthase (large subunit) IlvB1_3 [Mycobacterium marinum M]|uniref:acetolactate synthase n=2 Tax=Mycobacterium marinum TaxID=1781 RepID=B2HQ38_MYCMM|nr:thiamine pyrophosphate-binding protein [Mycobacterium marinum]ACC40781.1 acetolactate synthase (large subunit) IlvB1_3 [Mycobacterium marinum M]MDC8971104.1 thiamine pyrophosphate-binding protein [Mycobacterium marinum]GJO19630.1 acetolactate synthase [Mycobacterium marinum]
MSPAPAEPAKYSDQLVDWLVGAGYTHCFFVAGGNIMHLLNSVRTRMVCVPFVHEVAAAIAVEYFNASRDEGSGRALALVTAGPGLTNAVTGIAGAWQESRELLVLGGQVKSSDLSRGAVRQRGIQEIDGVELVSSVTKRALRIERPVGRDVILDAVLDGRTPRQGPVFLEVCLDTQAALPLAGQDPIAVPEADAVPEVPATDVEHVVELVRESQRPVVLVGGGVSRDAVRALGERTAAAGIPIMTTWHGADRVPSEHPRYSGRPNTWGQRAANLLVQQADLVIAIGTRLGLQQTGFAWEEFVPIGRLVQVDIDAAELTKGHPRVDLALHGDADRFLDALYSADLGDPDRWQPWREFIASVRAQLPLNDPQNVTAPGYVKPYEFAMRLAEVAEPDAIVLPCSSGGSFTVAMQALQQRANQKLVSNKSIAAMGYGLSGSLGAALANPGRQVLLTEGDGGFAQNLQELGTLAATGAKVKVFVLNNNGYASIRMTQRNYFGGAWIGCDGQTGLGLPDWADLARAYRIPFARLDAAGGLDDPSIRSLLDADGPALIEVPIDPDQTYYPKISSAVQADGSMKSNPLHRMSPDLPTDVEERVTVYLGAVLPQA